MLINLIEAPLLALILAFFSKSSILGYNETSQYIFGENANIPAYLFMAVIVALFMGLVISAEEIFKDRKILEREKFLNLSRSSYLNAKILILFLISIIQTSLFVLIGNYILEIKGMDWRHFMILFSTACWANMIGLNISAGFNSVVTIYILVPLILVPQLLFSGVVIDFQNMNKKVRSVKYVPLIGDIITSRWAYESMVVTQYRDNRFEKHFFNAEKDISNAMYTRAYLIPEIKNILQKTYLKGNSEKNADNIILLNNELTKLSNNNPLYLLNEDEKRISTRKYQLIRKFLDLQAAIQFKNYKNAIETKEKKYQRMVEEMEGNDKFIEYKNNYHNKKLSALVHNQLATTELVRRKNELIRIKDPVFNVPDSRFGRAHFYAPVKRIGNYEIDTFWFNILFVWLYTTLFYLILYFDLLHKLIIYVENFRLNRLNRRIFKFLTQEEFRSRRKKARTTLN